MKATTEKLIGGGMLITLELELSDLRSWLTQMDFERETSQLKPDLPYCRVLETLEKSFIEWATTQSESGNAKSSAFGTA